MDVLLFLGVLSVLVFVHEIGHFIAAKRAGIRIEEFGFGIPPRIWGMRVGETVYSINLLPIGGFVRLFGEDEDEMAELGKKERKELSARAYYTQNKLTRTAVVVAGVIMNFILGVFLFSGLYTVLGIPTQTDEVVIVGIAESSPAEAVFEIGDVIEAVDGNPIRSTSDFKELVDAGKGEQVVVEVERQGGNRIVSAEPRVEPPEGEGSLGVVISPNVELVRYPVWQMPFRGAWYGLGEAIGWGANIIGGLVSVVSEVFQGAVPEDVGGPYEIFYLVKEIADAGVAPLIQLVAVLSVNLAIVNLLPLPALDGGRMFFIGMEAVVGRRLNARTERLTHAIGMAFLLALLFAITVQDIIRRSEASDLGGLVERVIRM